MSKYNPVGRSFAPWTTEEVTNLNRRQKCDILHEYSCKCGAPLTATTMGWVCDSCNYTQKWCITIDKDFDEKMERKVLDYLTNISDYTCDD